MVICTANGPHYINSLDAVARMVEADLCEYYGGTRTMMDGSKRLATYGTLAPGQVNEDQLDDLIGDWTIGIVRGHLLDEGWGAAEGCPGIILDPAGQDVEVHVFTSHDLPDHWYRLDVFEGEGYRRVVTDVETKDGPVAASIYVLARGGVQ